MPERRNHRPAIDRAGKDPQPLANGPLGSAGEAVRKKVVMEAQIVLRRGLSLTSPDGGWRRGFKRRRYGRCGHLVADAQHNLGVTPL